MGIFQWLGIPLGWLMKVIYELVSNYGWAIVLFTVVTKFVLFPLSLKQQKTMAQTMIIKPKLDAVQKQYGDNKEKVSEETMKLYKKYGISPFSGCLPLLIQFPIIISLYYVIRSPMTYIWHLNSDVIAELCKKFSIAVVKNGSHEILLSAKLAELGEKFAINYNFLGLDLSATPSIKQPNLIWIIPVLAAFTTWLVSKLMKIGTETPEQDNNVKPKRPPRPGEKKPEDTTNMMTNFMPLMTLWFAFMLPAGLGLYWTVGNLFQIVQQYVLNKFYVPKIKERMAIQNEELGTSRNNRKKSGRSNKSRSH